MNTVLEHLDALGADYEAIECDPELADTAAFCAAYGYALDESANAILIASKRPPGQFALCLALATTRLDVNRAVRDVMSVKKLSFATPEQTIEATGMMIGGVTPFGVPADLPVYVDEAVMDKARVIVGGGSRSLKLLVASEVFRTMPNVHIVAGLAAPTGPSADSI
jgi:prolyl-tRNA editing enzyme YbaK/EbsC (Cys-tRNA(Pro) deacylase)